MSSRRILIGLLILYTLNIIYVEASIAFNRLPSPLFFAFSTLVPFAIALTHAHQRLGWKRMLILLGTTFGVSLLFESLGVATGWVYGPYHYTDQLGLKFLGLVPLFIPLGWFLMSYPSFVIADWIVPTGLTRTRHLLGVAALGGLIMTAWDVVVDPVRVRAGQWVWEVEGAYFGVPLQNYWGWWLTTFLALILFLLLTRNIPPRPHEAAFDRLAVIAYALTGLGEIGAAFVLGLGGPALAGFFAMLPWVILGWLRMSESAG
jgi:uncharacterized membrane protein